MEVTSQTFQQDVIEASAKQPVVVDFWAPWCGPCRALGPVLEKLEREYGGKFRLAKVNSDENGELSAQYGVRSIPYVLAFRDGRPVAQFVGALPESQVRAFIDGVLPSPWEARIQDAERAIAEGRADDAEKLLEGIPFDVDWERRVEALRSAIGYARAGGDARQLEERLARTPDDHEARLALAKLHAAARRYPQAMEQLVEIVRRDKGWRDGEARRELLNLFTLAEGEPELVSEYRRKLATALY